MRRARIGGSVGQPAATPRRRLSLPRYPGPVERAPDDARRRRIAIALVALAVAALHRSSSSRIAVGLLEVAALIFVIFVGGWFVLRSYQRRTGGA